MADSPFKFLDSYRKEDRDIFFGRDIDTEELYYRIFESKTLLVYGFSGTGKTSVINCGLANKFNDNDWLPVFIRREENICESTLRNIKKKMLFIPDPDSIKKQLSLIQHINKYLKSVYLDHFKPVYLIFDQFEELFIFGGQEEKSEFIQLLKSIIYNDLQCKIIIIIREEYLGAITEFENELPGIMNNRMRIEKMTATNARKVIENSFSSLNIKLEENFSQNLLDKLNTGKNDIELTYLQIMLDKLYKRAANENSMILKNIYLDELKSIGNVLTNFLDEQLSNMTDPEKGEAVLKRMISADGTKRRLKSEEIQIDLEATGFSMDNQTLQEILQYFVNARIITDKDENGFHELRHDSLAARIFERMTATEKEIIEVRKFIENAWYAYEKRKKLLDEADLKYISPYYDRLHLKKEFKEFIDLSKEGVEKSIEELKQQNQKLQEALKRADEMQRKVETAMFDKAVKEQNKEWKGYEKYQNNKDKCNEILKNITSLNLSENALQRLPIEVAYCINLQNIDLLKNPDIDWEQTFQILSNLPIIECKITIFDLNNIPLKYRYLVTGIEILKDGLTEIPENIFLLKRLTYLDLSCKFSNKNKFEILPSKLFELTELKHLNFECCGIDTLPSNIGNLNNLTKFNLNNNNLTFLPDEMGKLRNLNSLDLYNNKLTNLPFKLFNLINLTYLDLGDNKLNLLPNEIGKLLNLEYLNLEFNQITTLPKEIENLKKLRTLKLTKNKLINLPIELSKMKNLTQLFLQSNKLNSLPSGIGKLKKLTYLSLRWNHLESLPIEIENLKNITTLSLQSNKLTHLPDEIGKLSNLTYLNLKRNKLNDLPPKISQLKSLIALDLQGNQFPDFPVQIGKMLNLKTLNLADNQLTKLPNEIGEMQNLRTLNLTNNKITSLPDCIGQLTNLNILLLTNNQLQELNIEIGNLINMTLLGLGGNHLIKLPSEIGQLVKLTTLFIQDNELEYLPNEILNLVNLKKVYLNGNKFSESEKQKIKHLLPNCKINWEKTEW